MLGGDDYYTADYFDDVLQFDGEEMQWINRPEKLRKQKYGFASIKL